MSGKLYVVSTPIGNLDDVTLRALRTLREVDLIAAEDTRQTQKLLNRHAIHTPLTSYHEENREEKTALLIERLHRGQSVALVCDAGTPLISDPGLYLVQHLIAEGLDIVPIPGPSALLAALVASGLPTDAFIFEGFLPRRRGRRRRRLEELKTLPHTLIFYESPYRVIQTLGDCLQVLGNRSMALARELTKIHEEVLRGRIKNVLEKIGERRLLGECTLVIEGTGGDEARGETSA